MKDYEEWSDSVKKILSLMEKPDICALFDYPTAKSYYKRRLCLSGDGAHASTPHQGAGAGMALEDTYVMSVVLAEIEDASKIEKAFEAFDAVRRPRTQRLVATGREAAEVYECEADGIGEDREAFRRNLVAVRYKWFWEKHLEEDLEVAMKILRGKRPGWIRGLEEMASRTNACIRN